MKYETATPLGRGGMGEVFKAYDPVLGRHVALKYLRWTEPALVERFLREARLQARVDHELVCRVYDVGTDEGRPYIAMEYVDGRTLDEAASEMSLLERVEVVRQVALAVHAAHQTGLVHRDLKPQNVLVERTASGWKPHVVDFGLAREYASDGTTQTGQLVGTPAYMSPEQARGDVRRLDRRSDVYALGAVLYRLLVGEPPFVGGDLDVAMKVAYADPEPPRKRDPSVPADLDTIVMKCLEKEPARRYDSARALAEDLERYASGDLIEARPATLAERAGRFARRNRLLTTVIGVAALFSVGALGSAWRERRTAEARAFAAQRFGAEAGRMRDFMHEARLLPYHDMGPERAVVRERMKSLAAIMRETGPAADGPGHYALGEGHLVLGDQAQARSELEAAWRAGHRTPETAFALGLLFSNMYREALMAADESGATKDAHRAEAERTLRDPALAYLRAGGSDPARPRAYVDGLLAEDERRYDDAILRARAAFAEAPWLYEAKLLEGNIHMDRMFEAIDRGDDGAVFEHSSRAGAVYKEVQAIARSSVQVFFYDCQRLSRETDLRVQRGLPAEETFERGVAACRAAIAIDAEFAPAHAVLCLLHWRRAEMLRDKGQDTRDDVARAIDAGEAATRLDPSDFASWSELGMAYWARSEDQVSRGIEPAAAFERADSAFGTALRLRPGNVVTLSNRGSMLLERAEAEANHGIDPEPTLAMAVRDLEDGVAGGRHLTAVHDNLGNAHYMRGEEALRRGRDPRPFLDAAIGAYDGALGVNPKNVFALNNRGDALEVKARYLEAIGDDPEAVAQQAFASLRAATQVNPRFPYPHKTVADVEILRAGHALRRGGDPAPFLARARAAVAAALRIRNPYPGVQVSLAAVFGLEAEAALAAGRDARPSLAAALEALGKGPHDGSPEPRLLEARLALVGARSAEKRGGVEAWLARARAALDAASRQAPEHPERLVALAELGLLEAAAAARRGEAAGATARLEEGMAAADRALAHEPRLERAREVREALARAAAQPTRRASASSR